MASLSTVNLGTGRTATAISAGVYHTCALLDNASVKCWGYNAQGQLGIDSTTNMGNSSTTTNMASISTVNLGTGRTVTALAAGYYHSCAKLDNGDLKCWGRNNYGQLGIDSTANMGDSSGEMSSLDAIDL
jgi:alpha-tubulin suppressor-like RCC1 family protein